MLKQRRRPIATGARPSRIAAMQPMSRAPSPRPAIRCASSVTAKPDRRSTWVLDSWQYRRRPRSLRSRPEVRGFVRRRPSHLRRQQHDRRHDHLRCHGRARRRVASRRARSAPRRRTARRRGRRHERCGWRSKPRLDPRDTLRGTVATTSSPLAVNVSAQQSARRGWRSRARCDRRRPRSSR